MEGTPVRLAPRRTSDWKPGIEKVQNEGDCRYCRSGESLDPAHLWPRSLGGSMDRDNIVPLCRSCHNLFDSSRLDLLPYLTINEQLCVVREAGGIARAYDRLVGRANLNPSTAGRGYA